MTKFRDTIASLEGLSKHNPLYEYTINRLLGSVCSLKELDRDSGLSTNGYVKVYLGCMLNGFSINNFELSNMLSERSSVYSFMKAAKRYDCDTTKEFQKLLSQIENEQLLESELFWDHLFRLKLFMRHTTDFQLLCDNGTRILQIFKYAAEVEGKLFDDVGTNKMKFFAKVNPNRGLENAINFHLTKLMLQKREKSDAILNTLFVGNFKSLESVILMCNCYNDLCVSMPLQDVIHLWVDKEIIADDLWVFGDRLFSLLDEVREFSLKLIDLYLYPFIIKQVNSGMCIDSVSFENATKVDYVFKVLDKFDVEYYGQNELYSKKG